jgi:hypothetical protein
VWASVDRILPESRHHEFVCANLSRPREQVTPQQRLTLQ